MKEEGAASYSINGKEMSEADFSKAISEMPVDEVKKADIKATNASESVTNLLKDVATRSGVESAPMMETTAPAPAVPTTAAPEAQPAIPEEIASLKDDEPVVIKVKTLEEIPEEFRDRAEKSKIKGTITTREKILGLPIGKKTTKTVDFGYTYTLTGKEAKDYAIQKSKSEEGVLRTEQPEVELPTMGEGNAQKTTAQEGVAPAKPEEVKPTEAKSEVILTKYPELKNTKVVDEKGEPLTVYHGSNKQFNEFSNEGLGTYFTNDKTTAETYKKKYGEKEGKLYEAKVDIKNPIIIDANGKKWNDIEVQTNTMTPEKIKLSINLLS